jgi:diadenosine tetraphosphate (Ap4A) HIT family hydrolase
MWRSRWLPCYDIGMPKIVKYYYGRLATENHAYLEIRKQQTGCAFCHIGGLGNGITEVVEEIGHFWVVKNAFPYAMFDNADATDHLLIIPKKHVESIAELAPSERAELIEIVSRYEEQGYSWLGRSASNAAKSMSHQHTHLIKV